MKKLLLQGEIPVNSYFIEDNNKYYIVDPGDEKEKIIQYVKENGFEVLGILLTHGHIDHIGAIDAFKVPVYLHEKEYDIIKDNYKNGFEFYGRQNPYDLEKIHLVKIKDGFVLSLGDKKIEAIYAPGHTIGGVCYKIEKALYTGEGTVGKRTFPTGDLDTLKETVLRLIENQDEDVIIHPAHGKSSTIGAEKELNQFYLAWK